MAARRRCHRDLAGRSDVGRTAGRRIPGERGTWRLISERLAFQVVLEFGLRSPAGPAPWSSPGPPAAEVVIDDPARIARLGGGTS